MVCMPMSVVLLAAQAVNTHAAVVAVDMRSKQRRVQLLRREAAGQQAGARRAVPPHRGASCACCSQLACQCRKQLHRHHQQQHGLQVPACPLQHLIPCSRLSASVKSSNRRLW